MRDTYSSKDVSAPAGAKLDSKRSSFAMSAAYVGSVMAPSFRNCPNSAKKRSQYFSGSLRASVSRKRMRRRVSTARRRRISAESCIVSREMLRGMSSLSTTPCTKRSQSGRMAEDASMSTLREYRSVPGLMRPMPYFSSWLRPMYSSALMLVGASAVKCSLSSGASKSPLLYL